MQYRIEVTEKAEFSDSAALGVLGEMRELGFRVSAVHVIDVFIIDGGLDADAV